MLSYSSTSTKGRKSFAEGLDNKTKRRYLSVQHETDVVARVRMIVIEENMDKIPEGEEDRSEAREKTKRSRQARWSDYKDKQAKKQAKKERRAARRGNVRSAQFHEERLELGETRNWATSDDANLATGPSSGISRFRLPTAPEINSGSARKQNGLLGSLRSENQAHTTSGAGNNVLETLTVDNIASPRAAYSKHSFKDFV